MMIDPDGRQFRRLTVHGALWSLAMSLASGFVGAYLLHHGFGIATTVGMYGALLAIRFSMRFIMLPIVRRVGTRRAMLLGAFIAAFQFLPLINANNPVWLGVWILLVSAGDCLYWPIIHAANAVCGGDGHRGRQIAARQMASTAISVVGPVIGGCLLTKVGAGAEFGLATTFCLLSTGPLFWMGELALGPVPTARGSWRMADTIGLCAFAADGWMCAGVGFAWPMILFATLGSSYSALGWASSAAGIAGALAGLLCGVAIDRGHRSRLSRAVAIALLIGVALRVASGWVPWLALVANTAGAAVGGVYYPVLMSVVYDRAKRSGSAYQFHLSAEAGWDAGAILGCVVTAAVACSGVPVTLTVLPAALGVMVLHRCVRAETRAITRAPVVKPVVEQTVAEETFAQAA